MRPFDWAAADPGERRRAIERPAVRRDEAVRQTVRRIFEEIDREGEAAVARWSQRLDGAAPVRVDVGAARANLDIDPEDLAALETAAANIRRFHAATAPCDDQPIGDGSGFTCRRVWRPIRSAGLYAPGGTAPLFSTLLMLAIPAAVAGVPSRVAVTPPGPAGVHPLMLAAAALGGLDELWLVGGAQAIAALAFGAGLPKVDKLFGPGNAYVAEAKRQAADLPGGPSIDLPAGPSELMVIADGEADARTIAADLLSQAEHDADAHVLLVCTSTALIEEVAREVERQVATLPREATARAALQGASAILVRSAAEAVEVANLYAPEHLSLQTAEPERLVPSISCAGAVFVGGWAAEAFGDYVAGSNHVLPTSGAARTWAGLDVSAFMTSFVVQEVTRAGAASLAGPAARLARLEGLEAHARAAEMRGR
jgi:histidinol dehydrogenase